MHPSLLRLLLRQRPGSLAPGGGRSGGGPRLRSLLGGFPSWFRHRELSKAATQVQRHFRERKLRKLMRTLRSGKESAETTRREKQEAAESANFCARGIVPSLSRTTKFGIG